MSEATKVDAVNAPREEREERIDPEELARRLLYREKLKKMRPLERLLATDEKYLAIAKEFYRELGAKRATELFCELVVEAGALDEDEAKISRRAFVEIVNGGPSKLKKKK